MAESFSGLSVMLVQLQIFLFGADSVGTRESNGSGSIRVCLVLIQWKPGSLMGLGALESVGLVRLVLIGNGFYYFYSVSVSLNCSYSSLNSKSALIRSDYSMYQLLNIFIPFLFSLSNPYKCTYWLVQVVTAAVF